jgi:hypothetical protein
MMRSFIRQLSLSPLPTAIRQLWQEHEKPGSDPDIHELEEVLSRVIESLEGQVFIVMDALDECPRTGDRPERDDLLNQIVSLLGRKCRNMHILATSRPEPDIDGWFNLRNRMFNGTNTALNIEPLVGNDIKEFVRTAILQHSELNRWGEDVKWQMEERLTATNET